MSVAFVREESVEAAQEVRLPARPISPHANLVTARGLLALEEAYAHAKAAWDAAQRTDDVNERRRASQRAGRDAAFFMERLHSAELRPAPGKTDKVAFGLSVTIARDDGRRQVYRIVGEDEADPGEGSISYVSPMARALSGRRVGDVVRVGPRDIEIVAIGE